MIPSNPVLAVYILGAYGWATLFLVSTLCRPMVASTILNLADQNGVPRYLVIIALFLVITVGWPVTVVMLLATNRRN